jgi:hypothetical protein
MISVSSVVLVVVPASLSSTIFASNLQNPLNSEGTFDKGLAQTYFTALPRNSFDATTKTI